MDLRVLSRRACLAAVVLLAGVGGCASWSARVPWLRLLPASLGRSLFLRQQLTLQVGGQTMHRLDALLEVDSDSVRLALMSLGQTAVHLRWDGVALQSTRASWLPKAVAAEHILSDLQWVFWPDAAIAGALPPGWTWQRRGAQRVLVHGLRVRLSVRDISPWQAELIHHDESYTLIIESTPLEDPA